MDFINFLLEDSIDSLLLRGVICLVIYGLVIAFLNRNNKGEL